MLSGPWLSFRVTAMIDDRHDGTTSTKKPNFLCSVGLI